MVNYFSCVSYLVMAYSVSLMVPREEELLAIKFTSK